jgi:hypothetical protein
MNRMAMLVMGLLVMSCGGKNGSGEGEDGDDPDEGDAGCEVETWTLVSPSSDGSSDFYYRDSVRITLNADDASATISLADASGAPVAGDMEYDSGMFMVTFTPAAPLEASSSYTAAISTCLGDDSIAFSTSDLGGALEDGAESLIGRTYIVDLASATFVRPTGVGQLIQGALSQNILLGVTDATDTELFMMGAISKESSPEQDFCNPSIDFPDAADFSNAPYFQIGPQDTTLSVAGYDITISELRVSGDFASSGDYFGGGVLMGEIDARGLVDVLAEVGAGDNADEICTLIATLSGAPCEPCSTDGLEYCLSIEVTDILAEEDPNQTLEEVADCDPDRCDGGCP